MADVCSTRLVNGEMDNGGLKEEGSRFEEAKKELETWKMKAERAVDVKGRLILEKLEEEDAKSKAQQEMEACVGKRDKCQSAFSHSMDAVQAEILVLDKRRQDLLDKLKRYHAELERKRDESTKLKQKLKIYALIAETETAFTTQSEEEREDDCQPIRGVFAISQRPSVILQGGQALITFEEERVASQILKIAKLSVSCEDIILEVKPKRIGTMDPAVKFEVHLDVSRKEIQVSNIPPSMPEERMKDRLELSFSRPSRGGGEVDRVEYDKSTGTGRISFLQPGVADSLALRGKYHMDLNPKVNVQVGPVYKYQLCKFQTFRGLPKRTVLLDDIEDKKDECELQDDLEIYFQKPSNNGGEIERIKYISRGKTLQTFFSEDSQ